MSEVQHAYWEGRTEQKKEDDARIAELEAKLAAADQLADAWQSGTQAAQPPEGYPSWEDWLASYGYQIGYASATDCWILHKTSGNSMQYDDYATALAAAKKDAGR